MNWHSFLMGVMAVIFVALVLTFIINFLVDKKEEEIAKDWKPELPLRWWVDDLSHRICGLVDHPIVGLSDMPWPDNEKVYVAIDEEYHNQCIGWMYAELCARTDKGEDIRQVDFTQLVDDMKREILGMTKEDRVRFLGDWKR